MAVFLRDDKGNVAILFALALLPLCTLMGAAIDYSRATESLVHLQAAVDSTAMNLAKLPLTTGPANLEHHAEAQVRALAQAGFVTPLVTKVERAADTITVTASGDVKTAILNVMRIDKVPLSATSTVARGMGRVELALVLDNTGSMAGKKLASLKAAATDLVESLEQQVDPGVENALRIGLVPFSMTVNVGAGHVSAPWMDLAAASPIHGEIFSSPANRFSLFKKIGVPWGGCVEGRPIPYDVQETAPSAGTPATLFVPFFAPDEPDSNFDNDYLDDDVSSWSSWRIKQGNPGKYDRQPNRTGTFTSGYQYGPNAGCALEPLVRLTTATQQVKTAISAMTAVGDTNIPIGLIWGWHLLSPQAPFSDGIAYGTKDYTKFVVLMTDGQNASSVVSTQNQSIYSGLGYIWQNRLGIDSGSAGQRQAAMDKRLTLLCANMKARGIQIFTVRVEVTEGTSKVLRDCATTPDMFYDVQDSSALSSAFRAIGASINRLRISR